MMALSYNGGPRFATMAGGNGPAVASQKSRGALIVLEGLDRSGKTSQSRALASYLRSRGTAVEEWRFPDRNTATGSTITSYLCENKDLDDSAIHLLFSANRWEKCALMETTLRAGTTLIVDRYAYSGVAFSAAKGIDLQWCKDPDRRLPAADLVLYLEISPEVAATRGDYGEERYEKVGFQRKVAKFYDSLQDDCWKRIDASLPLNEVQARVREAAVNVIEDCRSGREILRLWPK